MATIQPIIKEITLNRTVNEDKSLGSFGFSIMGGAHSKLPAAVCSVESDGPAAISGKIGIGDQLLSLNGENVTEVLPKDLVEKIRSAPNPSTFILAEDESLKEKVLLLIKQHDEKKRHHHHHHHHHHKKRSNSRTVDTMFKTDEGPRKKQPSPAPPRSATKEIVIETSVNTIKGDVVKVRGGKIISTSSDTMSDDVIVTPSSGTYHSPPIKSTTISSLTSDQPSLLSSNSSGSLGGIDTTDEGGTSTNMNTSSEVTSGGQVFVVKTQSSMDSADGNTNMVKSNSPLVPLARKKNGDIRASLTEEVLVNELNSHQNAFEMAGNSDTLNRGSNSPRRKVIHNDSPPDVRQDKQLTTPSTTPNTGRYSSKKISKDDSYTQAVLLARKMYMLDGFRKADISHKLADRSDFGKMVAREYLNFFEFADQDLVECLRRFLGSVSLTGETYDRERVIIHFSEKYFEQNPYSYPSYDSVHGVTCAILLLNSDLHSEHGGSKMSLSGYISNLERIGVTLPKDSVKKMYDSIKKNPLESPIDDIEAKTDSFNDSDDVTTRVYHVTIPGTFVEVELPETAPVFKEGFIIRKNEMEGPHKKVPRGKRFWRPYYAHLKGFLLYFVPENGKLNLEDTSSAIVVTHCLAMRAGDYWKRASVMRVTTSDWHTFLLQASDINDLQEWIVAFNKAAALFSAPPLAAPIGSGAGFQRPTFPLAPTRNSLEQQKEAHDAQTKRLKDELEEHKKYKTTAAKAKKSGEWFEKYEFLQFEFNRFHLYLGTLHSNIIMDFNGPLPTGLVPSPSISTLATTGTSSDLGHMDYHRGRGSRDSSPLPPLQRERKESSPAVSLSSASMRKR